MAKHNYHTIWVSEETKDRLKKLKKTDTFDKVINNLLDLEEKYADIPEEIYEYEYMLKNGKSKLFRIIFSETVNIEYYNRDDFDWQDDIRAWYTGNRISDEELDNFIKFIIKDSNIMTLYEMEFEVVQNNVWIKRVGAAPFK